METFYTSDRSEWRAWLAEHFETAGEIWLVLPLQAAGEPAISYNDAVEEAGSIDVTHSGLIEEKARKYGLFGHFGTSAEWQI